MKKGIIGNRSIDDLASRLDRLEVEAFIKQSKSDEQKELEKLTPMEKYILKFNWYVREIMPYYKAEVMQVHNLTSEEYDRRTLDGDTLIHLSQPNRKFEPTSYKERIAAVLGLDYQTLQDKITRGEIKNRIAIGGAMDTWSDEDPNRVF